MFIGLHRHSHYSKRDGIAKIPDIIKRVDELGQTAWALTDHGTTSGLLEAYKETQKYNKAHGTNIKFIFGCEVYWIPNYCIKDRKASCHLLLLAQNETGYKNLLKLVTIGYGNKGKSPDNYFYAMRLTTKDIQKHSEGIIVTSACMGGILNPVDFDGNWDDELAFERAENFQSIFGDNFFLEVQTGTSPEQIEYNKNIVFIGEKLGIPIIVTEDSHYVHKEDAAVHRKWLGLDDDSEYYSTDDFYIHSEEEVLEKIKYLKDAQKFIDNTKAIADSCDVVHIQFGGKNFPELKLDEPVLDKVCKIVSKGWNNKIVGKVPEEKYPIYKKQISHELEVLAKCDYLTYFLMNVDFLEWARENGIRTGIGRGSVGGSLIAYLMDLTRIDPIKYGLIFERFAHTQRVSLPDVDTDVPNTRRNDVINYLVEKYGEVYHVRTFGTVAEKAAIQRAGKALGYSPAEVRELSKKHQCIATIPEGELKDTANDFLGLIQFFGVHASAIMLFPSDPNDWCAIEKQGEDYVCGYEYPDLEKQGLLKLDILGIKTLDAIQNCIDIAGIDIDMENLPDNDHLAFEMLSCGDVMGCFQVESKGMRKLLTKIKPENIFDLIPLVALYRPSTIQSGMVDSFVNRRAGTEETTYLDPKIIPSLQDTYGVLLYQEQAMKIVQDVAGYDLGTADMFRRAIGHKVPEEMAILIPKFVKDSVERGLNEEVANKLAEWLTNCASYQFNKSHSASYGYTCYETAYLKAHYLPEYICGYLNAYSDDKQENLIPYIEDAKRHGVKILPPDARKSLDWTIENADGEIAIRVGVSYIHEVGKIDLPVTRENLFKLNKNKAENLIKAGAVDYLGDRKELLKELYTSGEIARLEKQLERAETFRQQNLERYNNAKDGTKKKAESYEKMLKYTEQKYDIENKMKELNNFDEGFDKSTAETEVLGFTFVDPFDGYDVNSFKEPSDKTEIVLGQVVRLKPWKQKNGKPMCFFTIKCPSGKTYDIVMFNSVYVNLELNKVYRMTICGDKFKRIL